MVDYMAFMQFDTPGAYIPYVVAAVLFVSLLVTYLWFYSGRYTEWKKDKERANIATLEKAVATGATDVNLIDTSFALRYKIMMVGTVAIATILSAFWLVPSVVGYVGMYDAVLGGWIIISMLVSLLVTVACGYLALIFTVGWENAKLKAPELEKLADLLKGKLAKKS